MSNLVEDLKQYFENTPQEELDKDWEELKHLNDIGPTCDEYLVNAYKINLMPYLSERFIRCNHNKYKHLYQEWIDNLTYDQLCYFILEKERVEKNDIKLT